MLVLCTRQLSVVVPARLKKVECSCPRRQSKSLEMGQAITNSNNISNFTILQSETISQVVSRQEIAVHKTK